jgi:hypothetical protein
VAILQSVTVMTEITKKIKVELHVLEPWSEVKVYTGTVKHVS